VSSIDRWYEVSVRSDLGEENEEHNDICSLACLERWLEGFKARYPGLK
jgi:hypothetical protein